MTFDYASKHRIYVAESEIIVREIGNAADENHMPVFRVDR